MISKLKYRYSMRKSATILLTIALGAGIQDACAQSSISSEVKESYQEFRRRLKQDYNNFRSRIVEQYADFLEGEWHQYEPLRVPQRDETPKPVKQPVLPSVPKSTPVEEPAPAYNPDYGKLRVPKEKDVAVADSQPVQSNIIREPEPTLNPVISEDFDFYGMPLKLEKVDFNILNKISSPADAAAQWKALQKGEGVRVSKALDELASEMGLNGYLTFRLAEAYLKSKFPSASDAAIMSAVHFMLANMGYDARLALTSNGIPLMMLPMEQTVYGSLFLSFDGRSYTVFPPEGVNPEALNGSTINTCKLPEIKDKGRVMDLKLDGLRLPMKKKAFSLEGGGLKLQGELNENLFPMLYHYPQMPTEDFARSTLDPELRSNLIEQVRSQIGNKGDMEGVNSLLGFFHALPYATDQQRHGFEKPYFLEETLYYDKCDCEDRAIMFTWLLWNALGVPNHLIAYPGHESAAVRLKAAPEHQSGYAWGNSTYWSADPTYVGAVVGDIMPVYSTTVPHIDLSYE